MPNWSDKIILIAEDKEINYLLFKEMLDETKSTLYRTLNGIETVDFCRNYPNVDMILMDIKMPKKSGLEATREIRSFNQQVIIIAQTANDIPGERDKALEAGCNDYLAKPITQEKLIKVMSKFLKV